MGRIKDQLNNANTETVTLDPGETQFLRNMAAIFQRTLDELQNHFATEYLRQVAIQKHGYNLNDELSFKCDFQKYRDQLEITKIEPKN